MKKKSGWIAFFIGFEGEIVLQGNGMLPKIYTNRRDARADTHGNPDLKTKPPKPVKIEWMEGGER